MRNDTERTSRLLAEYARRETQRMYPSARDAVDRMNDHNRRVQDLVRQRNERYRVARQQAEYQIVQPTPVDINLPAILRNVADKLKQATGDFKMFHFSLQIGRLKIELSQVSRKTGSRS